MSKSNLDGSVDPFSIKDNSILLIDNRYEYEDKNLKVKRSPELTDNS